MSSSILEEQRRAFLSTIRRTAGDDYKVLVVDEDSRKLLFSVVKEDDILGCNIFAIEQLEDRRQYQPDADAIYLLTPLPHIVEVLKADLSRRRYNRGFLIWTGTLPRPLGEALFRSESRRRQIANTQDLNVDFYARESHLVTFQAPWSFHILFNPYCDTLVKSHLDVLTQKVVSVCVSLGEYPLIRYYQPRGAGHAASVLCSHMASFVQRVLDEYARDQRNNFPPESPRPRAILIITDRTMDLMAPFVHELTYQAMAMDLLPMHDDGVKVTYKNIVKREQPDQEEKDAILDDNDEIWTTNRHKPMKDVLVDLSNDFKKFQQKNAHFAETDDQPVSVNTIKDMMAGLPEFQKGKELFALHIDVAEKCARLFNERKLLDITSTEQCLATGTDEDGRKPKNLADQLIRLLDDDDIVHDDRVRLLAMYIMYRHGILRGDIEKLRCHGEMSPLDGEMIYNLDTLGARVERQLKDTTPAPPPLFPPRLDWTMPGDEISLSRFEPQMRHVLENICTGTLDPTLFPAVKPHLNDNSAMMANTSLRKVPQATWTGQRNVSTKPRQRLIVFVAGGATYSEARVCYDVSREYQRDVYLATTHMITPRTFARQVNMLSRRRKDLGLPVDQEQVKLPAWMNDPPPEALQSKPQSQTHIVPNGKVSTPPQIPIESMQKMSVSSQPAIPPPPPPPTKTTATTTTRPVRTNEPARNTSSFKTPAELAKERSEGKKEKKHHFNIFKHH